MNKLMVKTRFISCQTEVFSSKINSYPVRGVSQLLHLPAPTGGGIVLLWTQQTESVWTAGRWRTVGVGAVGEKERSQKYCLKNQKFNLLRERAEGELIHIQHWLNLNSRSREFHICKQWPDRCRWRLQDISDMCLFVTSLRNTLF